jgi:hypothetical protein
MITPQDEDYDDLPEDVGTRITLTLFSPSDFEERVQDLLNIPNTLLLFLNKLERLRINIYRPDEDAMEIEYSKETFDDNIEVITKTATGDDEDWKFHVFRKEISKLPLDNARKNINEATVVLAFPVDEEDDPDIDDQQVFAFLPIQDAGFSVLNYLSILCYMIDILPTRNMMEIQVLTYFTQFLIQTDFIAQANREDVLHSARNKALLYGVALTFRDAVLSFCGHPELQYKWMRYLPSRSVSDDFWKSLHADIIDLLKDTRCLWSYGATSLVGHLNFSGFLRNPGTNTAIPYSTICPMGKHIYLEVMYGTTLRF